MNTNFFSMINTLEVTGTMQITITKGTDLTIIVSTLLLNEACGDKAKNNILPLNIRGTAQELDEGYFKQISQPMQQTSGLLVNMEAYLKQLEEVKKQSAMQKSKTDKNKKEPTTKEKKFLEAMAIAEKLEQEGKFQDAWMKLPDPMAFPEHAEEIRKRQKELSNNFAPDLFGNIPEKTIQPEHAQQNEPAAHPILENSIAALSNSQQPITDYTEADECDSYDDEDDNNENENNYVPF